MLCQMYSIYDQVIGAFGTPFYCVTEGHAQRTLIDLYHHRGTPSDFVLFHHGSYDTHDGKHDLLSMPVKVVSLDVLLSSRRES